MRHITVQKNRWFLLAPFFLCFSTLEGAKADSTFFPDDDEITAAKELEDESAATQEWAALEPTPKPDVQQEVKPIVEVAPAPEQPLPPKLGESKSKPLKLSAVKPHPKAQPIDEPAAPVSPPAPQTVVSFADIADEMAPLAILEPTQEVNSKRWCLYSSAIRALKGPSKKMRIVCLEGNNPHRGTEVKDMLISMGIEKDKIQLLQAKGEQEQAGRIYVFEGA
jgi:hypothetical protein